MLQKNMVELKKRRCKESRVHKIRNTCFVLYESKKKRNEDLDRALSEEYNKSVPSCCKVVKLRRGRWKARDWESKGKWWPTSLVK